MTEQQRLTAVVSAANVRPQDCYQCGKCSASCPYRQSMDLLPRQVMRHLQLGRLEPLLQARAPWICSSCHTCSSRCPQEIDVAKVMEALRREAKRQHIVPLKEAAVFDRYFLKSVRLFGQSWEPLLLAGFNLRTGHFLRDLRYGPKLLWHGKVHPYPHWSKNRQAVRKLMQQAEQREEER